MAKKKKVEEEFVFVPPSFNEEEYIKKDLADSKVVILTTIIGILVGALAATLTLYVSPIVGFLAIIVMTYVLFRFIYRALHVNTTQFKRTDYIYKGGTYLVTAIALWILLLNPPFANATPPAISKIISVTELSPSGGGWIPISINTTQSPIISPGSLNITANVSYVGSVTVWLVFILNSTQTHVYQMNHVNSYFFRTVVEVNTGTYSFYIKAKSGSSPLAQSPRYSLTVS
ncbi:MAG: hypothetical protein QXP70_02465 [Methanomassiliicoccales archaeon]